jgi:PAS domain S-box-containing protein
MAESRRIRQKGSPIDTVDGSGARNLHLRAITAFSEFAIAACEQRPVLDEAVRVATVALGTDCGAIVQRSPGGPDLLRAGINWNEEIGLSGATRVSVGAWGVLAVRFAPPRSLGGEELDFLQCIASVVALSAIDRNPSEASQPAESEILQTVLDHIPIMISFWDSKSRLLYVNREWEQGLGWTLKEARKIDVIAAIDPDAEARRAEIIGQLRAQGVLRNREVRIRRKSGEIRDLIISVVPVTLDGEEEAWLSTRIDVTDSKRAEGERDRLLESEKAARAAAEAALERLRAIESITDTALQNLGLDDLLQELLTRVRGALNADFATVGLIDEERQDLYQRSVAGRPEDIDLHVRTRLGAGASGKTAVDGQPRIVHDLATLDLSHVTGLNPEEILALARSMICAPLRVGGKIVGVVTTAAREPNHFTEDDLKLLLVVADRVAPAIEQARLVEKVHAGSERLKALSTRLVTAQEEERRRIAVELHDEFGQMLTAVKIKLQSLERRLDAHARSELEETVASVDEAMERVRDLALDLRPSVLDDLGLPAALRWYADRFARDTGIEVHVSADPTVPRRAAAVETACFRITQEALTNIVRHGKARHVWVDLDDDGGVTALKIRDDGSGFDVAAARERAAGGLSLGLLGMEGRVSSLGGEFDVQSVAGQGTWLTARFPASARTGTA